MSTWITVPAPATRTSASASAGAALHEEKMGQVVSGRECVPLTQWGWMDSPRVSSCPPASGGRAHTLTLTALQLRNSPELHSPTVCPPR